MSDNTVKEFQTILASNLSGLLGGVEVRTEWSTMAGQNGLYSPRIDIAVGPFATGDLVHVGEYDVLLRKYGSFINFLCKESNENLDKYGAASERFSFEEVAYRNANSRCFIALEIENRVSRKHLMGGAINAAALGRVGIAVAWSEDKLRAFVKLREYLLYLASVGKNTFHPVNLLVLGKEQLADAVDGFIGVS